MQSVGWGSQSTNGGESILRPEHQELSVWFQSDTGRLEIQEELTVQFMFKLEKTKKQKNWSPNAQGMQTRGNPPLLVEVQPYFSSQAFSWSNGCPTLAGTVWFTLRTDLSVNLFSKHTDKHIHDSVYQNVLEVDGHRNKLTHRWAIPVLNVFCLLLVYSKKRSLHFWFSVVYAYLWN